MTLCSLTSKEPQVGGDYGYVTLLPSALVRWAPSARGIHPQQRLTPGDRLESALMGPAASQPIPKFLQIVGDLRQAILSGELPPGAEVPSERQIAARWRVARPTAARALQ